MFKAPCFTTLGRPCLLALALSVCAGTAAAEVVSARAAAAVRPFVTTQVLGGTVELGSIVASAQPAWAQPGFVFTATDSSLWAPAGEPAEAMYGETARSAPGAAATQMAVSEPGSLGLVGLALAACLALDRLERRRRRY